MQDLLNKNELEKILLTNWSTFLNPRKLMDFAKESSVKYLHIKDSCQIFELRVTRFEPLSTSFTMWLDIMLLQSGVKVNITIEANLQIDGKISYVNSIIN